MAEARHKRGRLAAIDLLPEEAQPYVSAALQALAGRKRAAESIREELNTHLLGLGLDPVSKSAFNRRALWLASYGGRMAEAREIAAVWAEKLGDLPEGDVGLLLVETLRTMIYDVVVDATLSDESQSVKMLNTASLATFRLEQARKISVTTRKKIMDDFAVKAEEAVSTVAKSQGLSAETAEAIKAKILGITGK